MNIMESTRQYEAWLAKQTVVIAKDLRKKKELMVKDAFRFFRGSFYRWVQLWPQMGAELNDAPAIRCVGDVHLENFGTWRDSEGRLVWGINDFDEAYRLPYTFDLVRLAASIILARNANLISSDPKEGCAHMFAGYRASFEAGGRPLVLAEEHMELREMALSSLANPADFWEKLGEEKKSKEDSKNAGASKQFIGILTRSLPVGSEKSRILPRVAGVGSLGRPRFVAIAELNGGLVAREAKALVPSACVWAEGIKRSDESLYEMIVRRAVRMPDPFLDVYKRMVVRRLAPDCVRIELAKCKEERNDLLLLNSMGWETANIHLGTRKSREAVMNHLKGLTADTVFGVAERMVEETVKEWEEFVGEGVGKEF